MIKKKLFSIKYFFVHVILSFDCFFYLNSAFEMSNFSIKKAESESPSSCYELSTTK